MKTLKEMALAYCKYIMAPPSDAEFMSSDPFTAQVYKDLSHELKNKEAAIQLHKETFEHLKIKNEELEEKLKQALGDLDWITNDENLPSSKEGMDASKRIIRQRHKLDEVNS